MEQSDSLTRLRCFECDAFKLKSIRFPGKA